jgi:hypothetical protein
MHSAQVLHYFHLVIATLVELLPLIGFIEIGFRIRIWCGLLLRYGSF